MIVNNNSIALLALIASALLWLLLFVHSLCQNIPQMALGLSIIIIFFQTLAPLEILKYFKINPKNFNIYAHYIETFIDICLPPYGIKKIHPHYKAIIQDIVFFIKISAFTLIPYIFIYWLYFKLNALGKNVDLAISVNLPPQFFYEYMIQIFVIALPEELFYRAFLQSSLLHRWPNHKFIGGLPVGRAIILTNIIFALGHLPGTWSPARLLTFFPGLLFSYLIYKNKSLIPAVLFHATCNIVGQILYASFFFQ